MAPKNLNFSRRILLAVTGLNPQVVTETLYALAVKSKEKFIPTEIHVITTHAGADHARISLLDPVNGQFYAFCKDYHIDGIAFPQDNIHVIENANGSPLNDIRTPEDNIRAADYIVHFVSAFCNNNATALHVSIAGGRKSMGFFAGYALSLFGRDQDSLSHVLVNEPFESLPKFYYPPPQDRILYSRNNQPIHTSTAQIMLADIPFVRLRGGIPQTLQDGEISFHKSVEEVQSGLQFISLSFDIPNRMICCSGKWIKLSPILLAFYLWLAQERVKNASTIDGAGGVSWQNANYQDFLKVYKTIWKFKSIYPENNQDILKDGFEATFFQQKKALLNKKIQKNLQLEASFYLIQRFCTKPYSKYGLNLRPEQIVLGQIFK